MPPNKFGVPPRTICNCCGLYAPNSPVQATLCGRENAVYFLCQSCANAHNAKRCYICGANLSEGE